MQKSIISGNKSGFYGAPFPLTYFCRSSCKDKQGPPEIYFIREIRGIDLSVRRKLNDVRETRKKFRSRPEFSRKQIIIKCNWIWEEADAKLFPGSSNKFWQVRV